MKTLVVAYAVIGCIFLDIFCVLVTIPASTGPTWLVLVMSVLWVLACIVGLVAACALLVDAERAR